MSKKRVIYYSDLNNDDFAKHKIKVKPLSDKFKYLNERNIITRFFASILYRLVAIPLAWIYSKLFWNVTVIGKKRLKRAHINGGYFLYGNHTQEADGVIPHGTIANTKRVFTICSQETFSIKGIQTLITMIGGLPVPNSPNQAKSFIEAIEYYYKKGAVILIYPEAHIWPYATLIRDFPDSSFSYPAKLNAPVVAFCNTYKKRKIFRNLPPKIVTHISAPIYPNSSLALGDRAHDLREQVHNFMVDVSGTLDNYEHVRYVYRPNKSDENNDNKN